MGLSGVLPTRGAHCSTAAMPSSAVTHVSSPTHPVLVRDHAHSVLHPLVHSQPKASEQRGSHTAHSTRHQKLYVVGFGPQQLKLCSVDSLLLVTAHRHSDCVDRATGCNSGRGDAQQAKGVLVTQW